MDTMQVAAFVKLVILPVLTAPDHHLTTALLAWAASISTNRDTTPNFAWIHALPPITQVSHSH